MNTVPTHGKQALLGTNPIAFAAPAKRHRPFVLDMATSSVAANKVRVYELRGDSIPSGWVTDENGKPVTDSHQAMTIISDATKSPGGGLAPLGGTPEMSSHKGYGLAMMVHILGGTLSGSSFSPIRVKTQRPEDPDNLGHFFCVIDPAVFRDPDDFKDDLDAVIDVLHGTPAADPSQKVLVHGELEEQSRQDRQANGIPMPPALAEQIRELCEQVKVPYLLG
jgi:LDH2 family malate/lactate/ureidoglycolate dehydrogenase